MPKIPDEVVRAVTDAAKIEDVVSDFVTLRKAGVNLTGLCPFHSDKHDGNFIVRPSEIRNSGNTYKCFTCGKRGGPVTFLMEAENMSFPDAIRYLGKKYCIEVDDLPLGWAPPPPRPMPPPKPPMELPRSWVSKTMRVDYNRNVFTYWYMMLPWSDEQRKRMPDTLWQYCVGGWRDGRVVFWLIDHEGTPRTAKLMKFYPMTHPKFGHRDKETHPGWIHNQEGCRQVCLPDDHTILKPLFGAHLLRRYPNAEINIVESEKTALVMANYYGNSDKRLWLACGGLKFLQLESMQPLIDQGRTVWLWPDRDGVADWQSVVDKLGSDKVQLYTRFIDTCWVEEDGPKADVADIAIRMMSDPDFIPRQTSKAAPEESRTGTGQGGAASAITDDERQLAIAEEWAMMHPDEPLFDDAETNNPELHQWRQTIRDRYNYTPKKK